MATASTLLPWAKATRTGVTQNEQTNDEVLRLTWTNDKTTLADRATAISELYAISHVVDPKIDDDRVTYAGTWRNAGCGWNGVTSQFFIELRKGWATITPESMAVYVNVQRSNQSGKLTLIRKWQFIDPSEVEKLMKSSNANTKVLANVVTDPLADGKTYEGEWLAITTEGPKTEQDGCTIIQTLIKAGDADLTVILGTNKMTSSREVYKWQTTADDLDAFRTHTGVYATEFDYKWDTAEVGIQKDWQPSQSSDMSLNLVARYIVKEPWLYPANGTDFVVINNLNGVIVESVRKFRNQTTIPAANANELVKAVESELGQFSGEVIKRGIVAGAANPGFVTVSSAIVEWKERQGEMKFPLWTTFTNSDYPSKITGYSVYAYTRYFYRTVSVSVTRTYYTSHPDIAVAATATNAQRGAGTNVIKQVVELGEGLFAVDTKTITTGAWTKDVYDWEWIASVKTDETPT